MEECGLGFLGKVGLAGGRGKLAEKKKKRLRNNPASRVEKV